MIDSLGQGVVQETLSFSQVPHFNIGGSLHLVVNNQVKSFKFDTGIIDLFGMRLFRWDTPLRPNVEDRLVTAAMLRNPSALRFFT